MDGEDVSALLSSAHIVLFPYIMRLQQIIIHLGGHLLIVNPLGISFSNIFSHESGEAKARTRPLRRAH